jgi:hypothetical protein
VGYALNSRNIDFNLSTQTSVETLTLPSPFGKGEGFLHFGRANFPYLNCWFYPSPLDVSITSGFPAFFSARRFMKKRMRK